MVYHFGRWGVCWYASQNSVPLCESSSDGTFPNIRVSCQNNSRKRRDLKNVSWLMTPRESSESVIHLTSDNLPNQALREAVASPVKKSKPAKDTVESIVIRKLEGKSQKRRMIRDAGGIDVLLKMKTIIAASYSSSVHRAELRLQNVIDVVRRRVFSGDIVVRVNDVTYTADSESFSSTEVTVECPSDTEKQGHLCVEIYRRPWPIKTAMIAGSLAGCLVFVIAVAMGISWCKSKRRQRPITGQGNSHLITTSVNNPALEEPVYDVINDDKPVYMTPPVVQIPPDGPNVAGKENAEGYTVPSASASRDPAPPSTFKMSSNQIQGRVPPTAFMMKSSEGKGRPQVKAVNNDYSCPTNESGPYQELTGSFQHHHEYQSLAGVGQRSRHPGKDERANRQRLNNIVPMAAGPANNNNNNSQTVTFNYEH
uniref:Uncharacterized protein n=1 Tax=Branchiostoma floridae TaxID=7739 RepID=C3YJU4_BRAFL|eukprot:XP_002603390.1 hypothetical protein BRAFLDRAFT_80382 [Branchiostoma floridae]